VVLPSLIVGVKLETTPPRKPTYVLVTWFTGHWDVTAVDDGHLGGAEVRISSVPLVGGNGFRRSTQIGFPFYKPPIAARLCASFLGCPAHSHGLDVCSFTFLSKPLHVDVCP
jgi:hypothetical protein